MLAPTWNTNDVDTTTEARGLPEETRGATNGATSGTLPMSTERRKCATYSTGRGKQNTKRSTKVAHDRRQYYDKRALYTRGKPKQSTSEVTNVAHERRRYRDESARCPLEGISDPLGQLLFAFISLR